MHCEEIMSEENRVNTQENSSPRSAGSVHDVTYRDGEDPNCVLSKPPAMSAKPPPHLPSSKQSRLLYDARPNPPSSSLSNPKMIVEESIIIPNISQIFYCFASVIQAQVADDLFALDTRDVQIDEDFNLVTVFHPCGEGVAEDGDDHLLDHETNDDELRGHIAAKTVPSLYSVFRYLLFLYEGVAGYSPECNIMALVYINRLTSISKLPLTYQNWRSVWLVTIMLAQKVWGDKPMRRSVLAKLLPGVNSKSLRQLEFKTLNMLRFITAVRPSLYARYYFELRQLYADTVGSSLFPIYVPSSDFTKNKLRTKNDKCDEMKVGGASGSERGSALTSDMS